MTIPRNDGRVFQKHHQIFLILIGMTSCWLIIDQNVIYYQCVMSLMQINKSLVSVLSLGPIRLILGWFRTNTNMITITNTSLVIFQIIKFASVKCPHIEANRQNHVRLEHHELVWTKCCVITSWFERTYPQSDDVFVIVFVLVRNLPIACSLEILLWFVNTYM
jgi:hypothetical protein